MGLKEVTCSVGLSVLVIKRGQRVAGCALRRGGPWMLTFHPDRRTRLHVHKAARLRGGIIFQLFSNSWALRGRLFSKLQQAAVCATVTLVGPVPKPEHKPRKRIKSSAQCRARSRVPRRAAAGVILIINSSPLQAFSARLRFLNTYARVTGWMVHSEEDLHLLPQEIMARGRICTRKPLCPSTDTGDRVPSDT